MALYAALHLPLLLLAGIGFARLRGARAEDPRLIAIALGTLVAAYTAFHAAVQPAVRYILPVVPLAAALAAGARRPPSA